MSDEKDTPTPAPTSKDASSTINLVIKGLSGDTFPLKNVSLSETVAAVKEQVESKVAKDRQILLLYNRVQLKDTNTLADCGLKTDGDGLCTLNMIVLSNPKADASAATFQLVWPLKQDGVVLCHRPPRAPGVLLPSQNAHGVAEDLFHENSLVCKGHHYLDVANTMLRTPSSFTVSAYVQKGPRSQNIEAALSFRDAYPMCGITFYFVDDTKEISIQVGVGDTWSDLNLGHFEYRKWLYISFTYDMHTNMTIGYVNGVEAQRGEKHLSHNVRRVLRIGAGVSEEPVGKHGWSGLVNNVSFANYVKSEADLKAEFLRISTDQSLVESEAEQIAAAGLAHPKQALAAPTGWTLVWPLTHDCIARAVGGESSTVNMEGIQSRRAGGGLIANGVFATTKRGGGGYVEIDPSQRWQSESFTVQCFFMKPSTTGYTGDAEAVACGRDYRSGYFAGWMFYADANGMSVGWGTGGGWDGFKHDKFELDVWTHMALTMDSSTQTAAFFVNGVEHGRKDALYAHQTLHKPLRIGAGVTEGAARYFFAGQLRNFMFSNYAKSADEIKADFAHYFPRRLVAQQNAPPAAPAAVNVEELTAKLKAQEEIIANQAALLARLQQQLSNAASAASTDASAATATNTENQPQKD